jgi:farnesoid X receptor beta
MIKKDYQHLCFSLLLGTMRPAKPSAGTLEVHNPSADESVHSPENFLKEGYPSAPLTGNTVQ